MKPHPLQLTERTFLNLLRRKIIKNSGRILDRIRMKLPRRMRPKTSKARMACPQTLNVALIGVGNMARWAYLPRLRKMCGLRLHGVFDTDSEAASAVALEFGARRYDSLDELTADKDIAAILVCSPPKYHMEAVLAAMKSGRHVLCEKPLVSAYDEARIIWKTANTANLRHMVNFSYRYRTDIAYLIRIVQCGILGTIYHVFGTFSQGKWFREDGQPSLERNDDASWRYQPGGGVVLELGSHIVDLFRVCFGEVARVQAWTRNFSDGGSFCDNASGICLHFVGGPIAQVLTSRYATGYKEHLFLEISGSNGSLRFDEGSIHLWTRNTPIWRNLLIPDGEGDDFLLAFQSSIWDRSKVVPGFWEGLKNCEIIEAIHRSAQTGNAIELPLDKD